MLVAGVDDAGRGCVLGPLVIAGVLVPEEDLGELVQLGVKDSKCLTARKREQLSIEIRQSVKKYAIRKLSPRDIDRVVLTGKRFHRLNRLEAETMASVIELLDPDVAYVDASDVSERRFRSHIKELLPGSIEVVSEHKADERHPVVSAASIIAKVERDHQIGVLRDLHGDFGSGYTSDSKTIEFLRTCLKRSGQYPDFVRKSWKPARRIRCELDPNQTKLMQS